MDVVVADERTGGRAWHALYSLGICGGWELCPHVVHMALWMIDGNKQSCEKRKDGVLILEGVVWIRVRERKSTPHHKRRDGEASC